MVDHDRMNVLNPRPLSGGAMPRRPPEVAQHADLVLPVVGREVDDAARVVGASGLGHLPRVVAALCDRELVAEASLSHHEPVHGLVVHESPAERHTLERGRDLARHRRCPLRLVVGGDRLVVAREAPQRLHRVHGQAAGPQLVDVAHGKIPNLFGVALDGCIYT